MPHNFICQYCGKEFASTRKNRKYCGYDCSHAAQITSVGKICEYCQKPFLAKKKIAPKKRFCSNDCRLKGRAAKVETFTCQYCNEPFERKVTPRPNIKFQFCSPACRNKARKLKWIPCPICGKMFKPRVHMVGNRRKKHCSKECADKALIGRPSPKRTPKKIRQMVKELYPKYGAEPIMKKFGLSHGAVRAIAHKEGVILNPDVYYERVHEAAREYMTGDTNPNWQGGTTCRRFGDNWEEQRQKALERDNYECQVCFEFGNVVHHIKPRRLFDARNINDANKLSNLITLCDKHHVPVEMGKIPCPKPKSLNSDSS